MVYSGFVAPPISGASSFIGRPGIIYSQKSFNLVPQLKLRQPARAQLIAGLDPGTQTPGLFVYVIMYTMLARAKPENYMHA
jgi:hypothetical protein